MENVTKKERYYLLDSLRGLALLLMRFYHAIWDLIYMFRASVPWFTPTFDRVLQRFICITFISVSGFCFSLGSHKLRRSLTVLLASAVITLATLIAMPRNIIVFGVLSLIGICMLIATLAERLLIKINPYVGATACLVLYILTQNVYLGILGIGSFSITLPSFLYANYFTAFLGFPHPEFLSSDYFSLFPWCFIFFFGFFLYQIFKRQMLLRFLKRPRIKPLEAVGRHTLIIYMLHQPIIFGALYIIFSIMK